MRRAICLIAVVLCLTVSSLWGQGNKTVLSTLYNLNAPVDGERPYGNLVQGVDGNFYGTTAIGGVDSMGTIFKVAADGTYTVLYTFQGGLAGAGSLSQLFLASDGNFYGTCSGGDNSAGMIFRISPGGAFTSLYSFTGGLDGGTPDGGVIEGSDGNFYGTTYAGGLSYGTIFKITPQGAFTSIYSFTGSNTDSGGPYAGLVEGSDGSLYGTTNNSDGTAYNGIGSIFKITKSGTFTNLYTFDGGNDGGNPDGALTEGPDGSFYGSNHNYALFANDDDDSGQGVLFKITPDGKFTTLYQFTGNADSGRPEGQLFLASDGNLYGTTTNSPQSNLFQLTPSGTFTTLGQIGNYSDALDGPILGSDGNFYGTTAGGGPAANGSIFKAVPATALGAPVQLTLSESTIILGNSAQLSWKITNAYSKTFQRCVASIQNNLASAGVWTGVQTGTLDKTVYGGTTTLTPTASGNYTYALTCGGTVTGFATLTVPPMTIATTSLANATIGSTYSASISEIDGLGPFTWSIASGSLPAGLTLDPTTGTISGSPTQSGNSSFVVQVRDSESSPALTSATLSITVATAQPSAVISGTSLTVPGAGATTSTVVTVSGFASSAFNFSCSGLPAKAQCVFGNVSGTQAYATAALQITTDGGLQSQSQSKPTPQTLNTRLAYAALPGLIALIGLAGKRRRSALARLGCVVLLLVFAAGVLTGCSGESHTTPPISSTPAGTSTVTVTASAGDQTATTTFTLTVQ